jgi:hypothetical protein
MRKKNSKHSFVIGLFIAILGFVAMTLMACAHSFIPARTSLDDQPPQMVSAFFGLDNAIEASRFEGADGMPITFSKRVEDPDPIDPSAFTVVTRSGSRLQPVWATTRPADEAAKRHTLLLIGEFGNEPDDPPVKVEVSGHLALAGGDDAHGLSMAVTPLKDGPSLVLAYTVDPGEIKGNYPPETKQIIVVVWDGGVEPMPGVTYGSHLLGYSVETMDGDVVQPIALGDIGGDNYEHLYLDTEATPLRVSMKSGLLMDPRSDPNSVTSVEVAGAVDP